MNRLTQASLRRPALPPLIPTPARASRPSGPSIARSFAERAGQWRRRKLVVTETHFSKQWSEVRKKLAANPNYSLTKQDAWVAGAFKETLQPDRFFGRLCDLHEHSVEKQREVIDSLDLMNQQVISCRIEETDEPFVEPPTTALTLRDGRVVGYRGATGDDFGPITSFMKDLGDEAYRFRFPHGTRGGERRVDTVAQHLMIPPEPGAVQIAKDGDRVVALGDVHEFSRRDAVKTFGTAIDRVRDVKTCEISVAVADDYQGSGLGKALFDATMDAAARLGYQQVVAIVHQDNHRMLEGLRKAGFGEGVPSARPGSANLAFVVDLDAWRSRRTTN